MIQYLNVEVASPCLRISCCATQTPPPLILRKKVVEEIDDKYLPERKQY